jgi:hypothetical protein
MLGIRRIARAIALFSMVAIGASGLALVHADSAFALTTFDQYTVFGEHGVFVGSGSNSKCVCRNVTERHRGACHQS